MRVELKDRVWLLAILAVGAILTSHHWNLAAKNGSLESSTSLCIYGVRPGDSMSYVQSLWGRPPGTDSVVWHYEGLTVRFAGAEGPVDAVVGDHLEKRQPPMPKSSGEYEDRGYVELGCAGSTLTRVDALYRPGTALRSVAGAQPLESVTYPRFHMRVEVTPVSHSSELICVDFTLEADSATLWRRSDIPAMDIDFARCMERDMNKTSR